MKQILTTPCCEINEGELEALLRKTIIEKGGHCSIKSFFNDAPVRWSMTPLEVIKMLESESGGL